MTFDPSRPTSSGMAPCGEVELCYETFGDPDHPTILLVMGFSAQLTGWPDGLVARLVDHEFHVVRFDNRDCGLSTKSAGPTPDAGDLFAAALSGIDVGDRAPYSLSDMGDDAMALLDYLRIERAHVVGASMGGMIAQHLAIDHPHRVLSVTSMMSTTGAPDVGVGRDEVIGALLSPGPDDPAAALAHGVEVNRLLSGPLWTEEEAVRRTRESIERSFHPPGATFHLAAIAAAGDRTAALASVRCPFLVIHGEADPLIDVSGGLATRDAVPGAELLLVPDMGHDLPAARWDELVAAIVGITRRV